ncbi:metal-dependent hydrolase [Paraburkholderia sediminicola]|uniref:metal-dependent hydrolase n=1 Tax=Paraburkholderia sediminicola TaxID=458836 RepID=UPI0038B9C5DE
MSLDTHKRDFSTNARLPGISALAAGIGALSTLAAFVLLSLIHLFTNLFFFHEFSFADRSPAVNTLGIWVVIIPVIGGLIVGFMARYGSEKIRGHGIPEAIEAILLGEQPLGLKIGKTRFWLRQQLGVIAALEHFFGYLGNWVLNANGLDAAHAYPTMLDLLRWHGAEEVEHRTVAFDIFRHMGGTYFERCFHMLSTVILLLYFLTHGARFMHRRDPDARAYRGFILAWRAGARRGCLPSFWKMIAAALRYFNPRYTPHHEGSTEQALAYLATSPAAQAAAHGGNWVRDAN